MIPTRQREKTSVGVNIDGQTDCVKKSLRDSQSTPQGVSTRVSMTGQGGSDVMNDLISQWFITRPLCVGGC